MNPLWIDANTLMRIAEGDTTLEGEMLTARAAGREILVVPKVWEEATVGNPFRANRPAPNMNPETVAAVQSAFVRIGATIDRCGTVDDRLDANMRALQQPTQNGQLPSVKHESDYVVLSQIAASARSRGLTQATIFSLDNGVLRTHAARFATPAIPASGGRPAVPAFNFNPITRTTVPPPRLTATTGQPSNPVAPGGGSAQGAALGSFVQGAGVIIKNGLTKYSQQKAGDEAYEEYERKKPEILKMLHNNPGMGARVDFYIIFQPGVNADMPDTYYFKGMTYAPNPGPAQSIMFETIPRGQLQQTTIVLPPDPTARREPPKELTFESVKTDLARMWNVTMGPWNGLFVFDVNGSMYWADGQKSFRHPGRWGVTAGNIEFKFDDDPPGWIRQWRITSSLAYKVVKGCVLPVGVGGFFEMTRAEWWNANGG